jgi:two-component system phosphate regulon sensor histidine kinase PhoR
MYRRVRMRVAYERDLAARSRGSRRRGGHPDGMVVLDTANRIKWANVRAMRALGLGRRQDVGSPVTNIVRQPEFVRFLESGDLTEPIVIESQRAADVTWPSRSSRSVSRKSC